jgi:hypothetical protein
MSKASNQWYQMSENQLNLKSLKDPEADKAWKQVLKIKELGHKPVIFHSEFNGYCIFDENSNDMLEQKTLSSVRARSKQYR